MPVRYLLDTNIASYVIKGNVPHVRENLRKVPMPEVGISAVTEAELRFGAMRKPVASRLQIAVEEFLLRLDILPWDFSAARHYAAIRTSLDSGMPMGNLDIMIAAQTLAAGATLVTHDRAFHRIKQLKIEDWTKPV